METRCQRVNRLRRFNEIATGNIDIAESGLNTDKFEYKTSTTKLKLLQAISKRHFSIQNVNSADT